MYINSKAKNLISLFIFSVYNKNSDQDYIDENTKIVVNPSRTNDTIEDNQCQSEVENACACDSTDENKSTFNGKPRITSVVICKNFYISYKNEFTKIQFYITA